MPRMASPAQAPPSPSASFYDLSDDEEGEYNTIRHTTSGKGVKLLYTKSKVRTAPYIWSGVRTDLTCAGLRPSLTVLQRQHTWFRSPRSAKVWAKHQRCASDFLLVCAKRQRLLLAPRLDPRVRSRRCVRHLRQGRPLRLIVTTHTVVSRAPTTYNFFT